MQDDLFAGDDEMNLEKILAKLLDKADIEMKTEIANPEAMSAAMVTVNYLKARKMPITSGLIEDMVAFLLLYNVSKERKRSTEIVEAFKALQLIEMQKKRTLLGNGGNPGL